MSRNQGITQAPRVLVVTTVASTLEAFLLPFARALRKQGAQVDALAADTLSATGLESEFDQRFEIGWSRSARCLLHFRRLTSELRALVTRESYDVVWVHTPIAAFVTRAALRKRDGGLRQGARDGVAAPLSQPRIVYTAHGFHFYRGGRPWFEQRLYRLMERRALAWTDVLVVMNDEDELVAQQWFARAARRRARCQLARIDGIGIDRVAWAPVTLDSARRAELRQRFRIPIGSFVVTMIAEMNANKRHELLIEAFALLRRRGSLTWLRLLLIGEGPREDELRALVEARGLSETVVFAGQLSPVELRELLALTNVGMLVSEREGLPRSLMELCAAGIPLAGTHTRGIVDEVADEHALASKPTAAALADLIEKLAKNPTLRSELAQAQQARLRERYDLDRILTQYLELLLGEF